MLLSLPQPAKEVMGRYLRLPFEHHTIVCPYFVNSRQRVRGALRARVGKGSPEDIVEEATILALKEKIDLASLSDEALKKFLVDHRLGIDCAGLVYYALGLGRRLSHPSARGIRKLIAKLRPAENTDVATLADDANSTLVSLADARHGDLIIIRDAGPNQDRDHVLLIHEVNFPVIRYTHSFQWSTDGKYGHGVKQGEIVVADAGRPLTEQRWLETGKTGEENETFRYMKNARLVEIRRLRALS